MTTLKRIYGASFIFSLSLALSAYVNSSFLSEKLGSDLVGVMYAIAAFITIVGLEILPHLVERIGNRAIIMTLLAAIIVALSVLITKDANPLIIAGAFIIFNASNTLVWYCLDLFIEHFSEDKKVGTIRGLYLSITNLAWIGAPILTGIILTRLNFSSLYLMILIIITITSIVLYFSLQNYHDVKYRALSSLQAFKSLIGRPDLLRITILNFILQFFYAWMVIYTPLYLHESAHMSFGVIGIIFTIMLVPFVLFQYPIGRLVDVFHCEKELLTLGILIMVASTALFGYVSGNTSLYMIAGILFLTRVGASIVEVVSESYFFKKVSDADAEVISLFRTTSPIAYIIAPLLGTVILTYQPYQILFYILAGVVFLGIFALDKLKNI